MSERNRWRHKKRGTTYREVGRVTLQCSLLAPIGDGYEMVLYQGEADGRYWCRPPGEFHDGRFEQLPDAQPQAAASDLGHVSALDFAAAISQARAAGYAEAIRDAAQIAANRVVSLLAQADELHKIEDHEGYERWENYATLASEIEQDIRALSPSAATEGGEGD